MSMSNAMAYTVPSGLNSSGSPVRTGLDLNPPTVADVIDLLRPRAKLAVHHLLRNLLHLPIPPLDAGHVVLHHLSPALAEVLGQRLLDARIHLLVGHVRVPGIRGQPQERPEEHDPLHPHLEVWLAGHLAGDVDHVAEVDAGLL